MLGASQGLGKDALREGNLASKIAKDISHALLKELTSDGVTGQERVVSHAGKSVLGGVCEGCGGGIWGGWRVVAARIGKDQ